MEFVYESIEKNIYIYILSMLKNIYIYTSNWYNNNSNKLSEGVVVATRWCQHA